MQSEWEEWHESSLKSHLAQEESREQLILTWSTLVKNFNVSTESTERENTTSKQVQKTKENKGYFVNLIEGKKREKIQLIEQGEKTYQANTQEERVNAIDW